MEELTALFSVDFFVKCVLGLLGIVIRYIEQAVNASEQGVKFTFKSQSLRLLLTVIVTVLAIFLKDDIKDLFVVTYFGAACLGYMGSSFFLTLLKAKMPKQ